MRNSGLTSGPPVAATDDFNVVVSSAGRRVALLEILRDTLRRLQLTGSVIAVDVNRRASAFHRADAAFLVPPCDSSEFIPALLELCRCHNVRLLVPTIDTELSCYAENRDAFAAIGTVVLVSAPETVATCADKVASHSWLMSNGFPTVRQAEPATALATPGSWVYPLLVKPRTGNSSRGVAIVEDRAQLEAATRLGAWVVETIAPGDEYTVDVVVDRSGRALCAIPRRRLEVRGGEVTKAMTVRFAPLVDLAVRMCEALPGAYGLLTVQAFVAPSGDINVIELNARVGGGFPLAWQAGGRYLQWLIEDLLGRRVTASEAEWRDGLVMLRYDEAVFLDASQAGL
jgi:carbamoyl-phosphate synthase large subunit